MNFGAIIGHDNIKTALTAVIENSTVSHAYIFYGRSGIGKTDTARVFAKMLTNDSMADVIEVTNDRYNIKKAAALSVDTVRLARAEMFVRPYSADKKVFIFPGADVMSVQAQNALLKVLEEPPSYIVIILIVENQSVLLPTIRSRAISHRFSPLSDEVIAKSVNTSDIILNLSNGSISRAKELTEDEEIKTVIKNFMPLAQKLRDSSYSDVYTVINFFEKEKANCDILFDILIITFRDLLLINDKKCDTMSAVCIIELIEKSRKALQSNANYNMVISELLLGIKERNVQ